MKSLVVKVVLSIILIFLFTYASAQQNQSESRDAEFYCNRGNAYLDKGQHQRAILDYTRALEINPRYAEAYNNRRIAYEKIGQHDRTIWDDIKAHRGEYPEAKSNILIRITHYIMTHYIVIAVAVLISFLLLKKFLTSKEQAEYLQKHFPAEESYKEITSNKRRTVLELISTFFALGVSVGGIFLLIKFIDIYYPELNIPHKASITREESRLG
jgi:tetratricopeptide (TPR) repeat protein